MLGSAVAEVEKEGEGEEVVERAGVEVAAEVGRAERDCSHRKHRLSSFR